MLHDAIKYFLRKVGKRNPLQVAGDMSKGLFTRSVFKDPIFVCSRRKTDCVNILKITFRQTDP